jgi:hypothetical protein
MNNIDEMYAKFLIVKDEIDNTEIETEQDTRFNIIDRILIEVLGWDRMDIKTEPPTESG